MEEQNSEKQKTKFRMLGHIFVYTLFSIMTAVFFYSFVKKDEKINTLQNELQKNVDEKSSCISLRDSLMRENGRLYVYKPLTKAMLHRDEATHQLKHIIGDIVILKVDSSRVIIEDIIIGGNNYEYYIKYSVMHKDRSIELVSPDLIY